MALLLIVKVDDDEPAITVRIVRKGKIIEY